MPAKVNILGRLTRDPESREAGSTTVTSFSLASNSGWGDNKTTTFFDCSCFGKRGEALQKHADKGTQLWVSGDLSTRSWTGKDGVERSSINVRIDDWHFTASGQPESPKRTQAPQTSRPPTDGLPF